MNSAGSGESNKVYMNDKESQLVSVVIPIYNSKNYIEQCVCSVINQTYTNLEILLVDDGSTDNSLDICNELGRRDNRVVVLHQENRGCVCARQLGACAARGEFVYALDSDDWIDPTTIERMMCIQEKYLVDIVMSNYYKVNRDDNVELNKAWKVEGLYSRENRWDDICTSFYGINDNLNTMHNVWGKLIKRDLYIKAQMLVNKEISTGEDLVCCFALMSYAKKIYVINDYLYYYRMLTSNSMTNMIDNRQKMNSMLLAYECISSISDGVEYENVILLEEVKKYIRVKCDDLVEKIIGINSNRVTYILPLREIQNSKRIVIYGAGKVGRDYEKQIITNPNLELIAFLDENVTENVRNVPVMPPCCVSGLGYDIVLVAISNSTIRNNVKDRLIDLGVACTQIVCVEPIRYV